MRHAKLILKAAGNSLSKVDILTEKVLCSLAFALLTSQRELKKVLSFNLMTSLYKFPLTIHSVVEVTNNKGGLRL